MTILLPLEVKVREFHSKIFLASKILNKTSYDVLIGEKSKVYNLFKKNKSVYLLSKGGPRLGFRFEKKKYKHNFLGILDEEGPISNFDNDSKKTRLNSYILENVDDYFLWGKEDLKKNNSFFFKFKKKLKNYGHPKFDILKKNHIKFYEKEIKLLKKKYKKFIFVSSSFPVDQVIKQEIFNKFRFYNIFFVMKKKKEVIEKNYNKFLKLEKENYLSLIDLLNNFAHKNPDINIVFRPHPRQRIDLVKKRFNSKNKNIKIIYEDVITPWIAACELYLHGGCSSSLEAASLGKKIIYYEKHRERKAKMFREFGYHFEDFNKCLNFMYLKIKKNKFDLKKSQKPIRIIQNSKKEILFYENFINFLLKKYRNKLVSIEKYYDNKSQIFYFFSKFKVLIKKIILKIPILTNLFFIFDPEIILSHEHKKNKFSSLKLSEIKESLFRLSNKNKVKIKKLSDDLFLLKNNN